jgi:sugar diacid utilization regulator
MNVLQAAQLLGVHPNTLYARFQRIFDLTGLQPRVFGALATLLVVADCKPKSGCHMPEQSA